jgi:hypothetical protein
VLTLASPHESEAPSGGVSHSPSNLDRRHRTAKPFVYRATSLVILLATSLDDALLFVILPDRKCYIQALPKYRDVRIAFGSLASSPGVISTSLIPQGLAIGQVKFVCQILDSFALVAGRLLARAYRKMFFHVSLY